MEDVAEEEDCGGGVVYAEARTRPLKRSGWWGARCYIEGRGRYYGVVGGRVLELVQTVYSLMFQ